MPIGNNSSLGIAHIPTLPTDKLELSYHEYALSKEIKDQLHQLSQERGCSLFMTLLALLQVLLHRYTGQKDIVVGSPIANRHHKKLKVLLAVL